MTLVAIVENDVQEVEDVVRVVRVSCLATRTTGCGDPVLSEGDGMRRSARTTGKIPNLIYYV